MYNRNSIFYIIIQKYLKIIYKYFAFIKYKQNIKRLKKRIGTINSFTKVTLIQNNSVALIEPNPFHAETLPGYIKYFTDLGFNVDVFISIENAYEKPFILMPQKFRIFIGEGKNIQKWMSYKNMKDYSHIFFSSLIYNKTLMFMPSLLPKECKNIMGIEHNKDMYNQWLKGNVIYRIMKENGKIAALSPNIGYQLINPHYFGNIKVDNKHSDKIIFVAVGSVSRLNSNNFLIDSIRKLKQSDENRFEVHIIGSGELDIPIDLQSIIIHCGRLDFPSMYKELENSDFILAMLNPNIQNHLKYLNGTTSGTVQLSLGFKKPLIINSKFAKAYSFNNNEAIIYEDDELSYAMKYSIDILPQKYVLLQQNIYQKSQTYYKESIESIKRMILNIH